MRKMKDSGIEWIGEIPEDWISCYLKNVVNIFTGNSIKDEHKQLYEDKVDAVPYISSKDIDVTLQNINYDNGMWVKNDDESFKRAPKNSTLMCIEGGSAGKKIAYTNQTVCFVNKLCCFLTKSSDSKFIYYYLMSPAFTKDFYRRISGLIGGVSVGEIKKIPFVLPSKLDQQRSIATYLDRKCSEIDTIVRNTEKSIEEYKKLKQSLITEIVTGKKRVADDGLSLSDEPRKMKDSGVEWVKQIPVEWNTITPKVLFLQRKEKAEKGEKQLTSSQQYGIIFQDEYMELTGTKIVTVIKDFDILKHVEAGDFVISMRSFQGGLEYSTNTGSISSAYVMLIPNLKYVFPRYYRWLFKSQCYIKALQSTSNMVRDGQAMRYSNFSQINLFLLSLEEQERIADYLDLKCSQIDKLISEKQKLVEEMETYKKSLIFECVTGKREVI